MTLLVTIGHGDAAGHESTPADVRDAAHAHDDHLREAGVVMGVAEVWPLG